MASSHMERMREAGMEGTRPRVLGSVRVASLAVGDESTCICLPVSRANG